MYWRRGLRTAQPMPAETAAGPPGAAPCRDRLEDNGIGAEIFGGLDSFQVCVLWVIASLFA